jgi:hypothetical protein
MTVAIIGLLLNLLIVGLLMATISYCWVLNKRIKILQDGKSELANLLQYFDESTSRASESIVALQSASKKIGENIQSRIDKVNYLMDDLAFMVEKGNKLADKLDASFAVNRARSRVLSEDSEEDVQEPVYGPEKMQEAPVVKTPARENISQARAPEKTMAREKTAASLEAVLERVVGRKPANLNANQPAKESPVPPAKNKTPSAARSKAEQELLDMIRAGIKG